MNEPIWINGAVMPLSEAHVGVEDRGFQFADGVYEVIRLYDGRPFTLREHLERLERSAAGIRMKLALDRAGLTGEILRFIPRTSVRDGMIYLQSTRGCSARNLFIVRGGKVITHPVGPKVLPGITRLVLFQIAAELGVEMIERPVRFDEAMSADGVFITSTTREIGWVKSWDGRTVGDGT